MKKTKLLKSIILLSLLLSLTACNKNVIIDTSEKNIDVELSNNQSNNSQNPYENFYSFHFKLNGDDLKLQMSYQELYNLGWKCELKIGEKYLPHKYLEFKKGDASFQGFLSTRDNYFQNVEDAVLSQVVLNANTPNLTIELPKGVDIDKTNKDELIKLIGEPSEQFEHPDEDLTYYLYEYDINQDITIIIDNKTNKISKIDIEIEYTDSTLLTIPKIVNNYTLPKKLSSRLDSQEFSLDGQIYKAPVPIQVFLDHGWELKYHENAFYQKKDLINYRTPEAIIVQKGDQKFEVEYENLMYEKQPIEKCIAVTIAFDSNNNLNNLLFPQNISLKSQPKDILKHLNQYELKKEIDNDVVTYYVFLNEYSHFEFTTDKEETKLLSLFLCNYPHLKK